MEYVGLTHQIRRNNTNSFLLLIAFPAVLLAMCYAFIFFLNNRQVDIANYYFLRMMPVVLIAVLIWFAIAWVGHAAFIRLATSAKPLDRIDNKRVYNLLENLCISQGMTTPKLYIINDDSLNAFASGINNASFSITLSSGIIAKLTDEELEAVMAHELSHIRNRDVRLLIVSIIFVGIFSFLAEMAFRSLRFAGGRNKDGKGTAVVILIAIVVTALAYLISLLLRFGISRRREYLADAGSAEMTHKPYVLAAALRKIAADPLIEAVENRDVAQLFIENPKPSSHKSASWDNLFSTHPPLEKRIALLEQFV